MIKKYFSTRDFILDDKNSLGYFAGYASVFDVVDQQNDIIIPGAFKKLNPKKVKLLWQHDHEYPIGKIHKIFEDEYGLWVEGQLLLDLPKAQEIYTMLKEGIISHMSIGYVAHDSVVNNRNQRVLKDVDLFEISLVTFPANDNATIMAYKNYDLQNNDEIMDDNLLKKLRKSIQILEEYKFSYHK